jgi:hypothetical protein
MQWLLGYWVIGCLIAGTGMAGLLKECPGTANVRATDVLVVVATWPATLAIAFTVPTGHVFAPPKCATQP